MADIADAATDAEQALLSAALSYRAPTIRPNGRCRWCQDALDNRTALFCDADCRDDYEKHQRQK